MYQSIHTIEYCLGTISNTASYLCLGLPHQRTSHCMHLYLCVCVWGVCVGGGSCMCVGMCGCVGVWVCVCVWVCFYLLKWYGVSPHPSPSPKRFTPQLCQSPRIEFQNKFCEEDGIGFKPSSQGRLTTSRMTLCGCIQ